MADWKDNYRQGSFRGVPFYTKSHEYQSGRRKADHEFPTKEQGNSEDLGKKLPGFNLDVYVLGDDYFEKRDALITAFEELGPGLLIHPYLGNKTVQVGQFSIKESADEGRIAHFTVNFVIAGTQQFPSEAKDIFQSVLDGAAAVIAAAGAALEAGLDVLNSPARVAQAAASLVGDATDLALNVSKTLGGSAQAVADVGLALRSIKADALILVRQPALLASRFQSAFDLMFDAATDFKALSKALGLETSAFAPVPVVDTGTPTSQKLIGNQLAIQNFVISISVSNQAKAAIQGNYVSVDESVNVRDLINGVIDGLAPNISDDETFQLLDDLQVSVNEGLPPSQVGEVLTFTPGEIMPTLVICQRLFGAIDKEEELIAQNKIAYPQFVPGRQELKVSIG